MLIARAELRRWDPEQGTGWRPVADTEAMSTWRAASSATGGQERLLDWGWRAGVERGTYLESWKTGGPAR